MKTFIAAVVCVALAAIAFADGPINQICKSSSIKEWGQYREGDDGVWTVECCGKADRVDGGSVAFLPEHGNCEGATGSTLALARSACRTAWAAKRCP